MAFIACTLDKNKIVAVKKNQPNDKRKLPLPHPVAQLLSMWDSPPAPHPKKAANLSTRTSLHVTCVGTLDIPSSLLLLVLFARLVAGVRMMTA